VNPVSIGSRVSVLQITLQVTEPGSEDVKVCVISTVTQGNLATETGLNLPTECALRREDIPDRQRDCEEYSYAPRLNQLAPVALKVRQLRAKRHIPSEPGATKSNSIRNTWYTFRDETGFDVLSLGYLTDMV